MKNETTGHQIPTVGKSRRSRVEQHRHTHLAQVCQESDTDWDAAPHHPTHTPALFLSVCEAAPTGLVCNTETRKHSDSLRV